MSDHVDIRDRDFWVKVVEMLQQNWALIDDEPDGSATIHFVSDSGSVFDGISFASRHEAQGALQRNRFRRFAEDSAAQSILRPPSPPFRRQTHPNGRIYSSGRFWIAA
jgi:hypothetical protein